MRAWPPYAAEATTRSEQTPHFRRGPRRHRPGTELRSRLQGLRSLRVGTYRIIYQLSEDQRTVRVAAIRHRSIAYQIDPR